MRSSWFWRDHVFSLLCVPLDRETEIAQFCDSLVDLPKYDEPSQDTQTVCQMLVVDDYFVVDGELRGSFLFEAIGVVEHSNLIIERPIEAELIIAFESNRPQGHPDRHPIPMVGDLMSGVPWRWRPAVCYTFDSR